LPRSKCHQISKHCVCRTIMSDKRLFL